MTSLSRAIAIERKHAPHEFAAALERLDPPATDAEREYLRGMFRRAQVVAKIRRSAPTYALPQGGRR